VKTNVFGLTSVTAAAGGRKAHAASQSISESLDGASHPRARRPDALRLRIDALGAVEGQDVGPTHVP
jgi:hypothetical protein